MSRKRQAVVVIHGIGEQRPMSTLRGFVQSMLFDPDDTEKDLYYNKPDPFSGSFELRTLTVYPSKGRPRTDYYEYYWAYKMRGSKFSHVFDWLKRILVKRPKNIPKRIRWVWLSCWLMILTFVVLTISGAINFQLLKEYKEMAAPGAVLYLFMNYVSLVVIKYLGDAARYTDADPENIQERQDIRTNGVALLKKLHECGKYDQIKIVGHSLGSIIGYDIINHLWSQYNTVHNRPVDVSQDTLEKFQEKYARTNSPVDFHMTDLKEFQDGQNAVLEEQHKLGNPWLISDFVTLGSPLTYASMLMADNVDDLRQRQQEREFPMAPPIAEKEKDLTYPVDYTDTAGGKKTIKVLHHAAPFALTRWHNVYFKNDFVGGPLRDVFGTGINDFQITLKKGLWGVIPFLSHTRYWSIPGENEELESDSIKIVKEILVPAYKRKSIASRV